MEMLEDITARQNLNKAFKKVKQNRGAGGTEIALRANSIELAEGDLR